MLGSCIRYFAIRTAVFYARYLGGDTRIIPIRTAGRIIYTGFIVLTLDADFIPTPVVRLPPSILAVRTRAAYAGKIPTVTFPAIFMALPLPIRTTCARFSADKFALSACGFRPDACFAIISKFLILAGTRFLSLATGIRIPHIIPAITFIAR
jgi:hypothetical protein